MSASDANPHGPSVGVSAYDKIAHLYDADMARNMAFDDIGCYVALAGRAGGRVLEVGCGNGRILLKMLASGADAFGVDYSAGMLAALCAKAGEAGGAAGTARARVARMDARSLALGREFALVLCPYSLVTYMSAPGDVRRLVDETTRVLRPGGAVVVDAFIPMPAVPSSEFRLDYRRQYGHRTLVRSKRITVLAPDLNRIERHYELRDHRDAVIDTVDTIEEIRTFSPADLMAAWTRPDLALETTLWDYAPAPRRDDTQFCTLVLRKVS